MNIIERYDKLIKPLENHVRKLEKMAEEDNYENKVVNDFLDFYRAELAPFKEFEILLLKEFLHEAEKEDTCQ